MSEQYADLVAVIARVRTRWRALIALRAWRRAATVAAALTIAAFVATRATGLPDRWDIAIWIVTGIGVLASVGWTLFVGRVAPIDAQVARFIEERCPELDDTLATAIADPGDGPRSAVSAAVLGEAARRARALDLDRVVSRSSLRQAGIRAAAASVALLLACAAAAPPVWRSARTLSAYLFPERLQLEVQPGDVKVRAGQPLEITARIPGAVGDISPTLQVHGDPPRNAAMPPGSDGFSYRFPKVDEGFTYSVSAGGAASRTYSVTVLRPPRVERIDVRYDYPADFGMKPRVEQDGGDIYGPAGTRVHLSIYTDKPVTSGALALTGGAPVVLRSQGVLLEGELTIADDGSYRIALADADGLRSAGDTEYFIRTLADRPPDVRIVRPAADRQVTPLEEVSIEARADDDFGIASFDLVYAVRGGEEKVIPLRRNGAGITVTGNATVYLEDLMVQPGDFVTYYARARDVSRGKRSTEARSDMFFLQVSPFEEEFVASQSQGAAGSGDTSLDEMVDAQKNIVTATWTLDRRSRDAGASSADDVQAVARAQADLRRRALAAAAQMQRNADVRRRRPGAPRPTGLPPAEQSEQALAVAAEAMLGAQQQLEAQKTSAALPFEMKALNELMRAQADVRRREVQRQQNGGGAGRAANRQQQDLSSLFDRELARQQQTNYETPRASTESRQAGGRNADLDKVRELARRQEALNREQASLAVSQQSDEERRRQLERLTREQTELRQQAEELARQQRQQRGDQSGQQRSRTNASDALQGISEEMRAAASELRRQDSRQAGERGSRALDQLKQLERQMSGDAPDTRQRAIGELQRESGQIADEQRQLAERTDGQERASDQGRLAERMQQLEQSVRDLSRSGDQGQRRALSEAARELERGKLSDRMRNAARSPGSQGAREAGEIARQLDQLTARLGTAAGESAEAQKLGEELARLQQLRDRLARLDREVNRAESAEQGSQVGERAGQPGSPRRGQPSGQRAGQPQQPQQGPQPGAETGQAPWGEARALIEEVSRDGSLGLTPGDIRGFNPGQSAPGTEAWKQDYARWEQLKVQIAAALQKAETGVAARLRQQQAEDRLAAGASEQVPEQYRRLVDQYYRALAAKRPEGR